MVAEDPDEDYEADQYEEDYEESEKDVKRALTRTNDNKAIPVQKESESNSEEERDMMPGIQANPVAKKFQEDSERDEYSMPGDDEENLNIDENQMLDIAEYIFNAVAQCLIQNNLTVR